MKRHLRYVSVIICWLMLLSSLPQPVAAKSKDEVLRDDALAYMEFGNTPSGYGMKCSIGDENTPKVLYEAGKYGWLLSPSEASKMRYIYVDVDNDKIYNVEDGSLYEVEIEYFDYADSSLTLEYGKYSEQRNVLLNAPHYNRPLAETTLTPLEILDFTGTKTWKTYTYVMPRAAFNNTVNNADFRLAIYSTKMGYSRANVLIHSIKVKPTGKKDIYDISVKSDNMGNIFFTDQKMSFDLTLDPTLMNHETLKADGSELKVDYTLKMTDGTVVDKKTSYLKADGLNKLYDKVELTPQKYGLYKLETVVSNDELKIYSSKKTDCSYCFTTYGEVKNPRHGVSVALKPSYDNAYEIGKLLKNAGFSLARINLHPSFNITGAYDYYYPVQMQFESVYRTMFRGLKEQGIGISAYTSGFGLGSETNNHGMWFVSNDIKLPNPEVDGEIERWTEQNLSIIRQCGDLLDFYEIDNEPNIIQPKNLDKYASRYAVAQNYVYKKIKEEFPELKIGGGTISGEDPSWLKDLLAAGGGEGFDVFSVHPYRWGGDPILTDISGPSLTSTTSVKDYRAELDKNGYEDKPLCAAEYGYACYYLAAKDEYYQACYNIQNYFTLMHNNLCETAILFMFCDVNGEETRADKETGFGCVGGSNTKELAYRGKANYLAQAVLNNKMADAESVGRIDVEKNHTLAFRYNKTESERDLMTLFTNKDYENVSFDLGTDHIVLTDMYGNEKEIFSDDGKYTFTATMEPFYVEGNFTKWEICDSSEIHPKQALVAASYGKTYEVQMVGNEKNDCDIEAKFLPQSSSAAKITAEGNIVFSTGNEAPKKIESVEITVKKGGKTYFSGYIGIDYKEFINMSIKLRLENSKWYACVDVKNTSENNPYSGTLEVISPDYFSKTVSTAKVLLEAGESKEVMLELPSDAEKYSQQDITVKLTDDNTGVGITKSERLDFMYASKAPEKVTIDGDLSEFDNAAWIYLDQIDQFESVLGFLNDYKGTEDIWGKASVMWDEDNLYFGASVYDDVHYTADILKEDMWSLDDIQIGVLYDPDNTTVDDSIFEEISFALMPSGPELYRHKASGTRWEDATVVDDYELAIVRDETAKTTTYELKLPWNSITPLPGIKGIEGNVMKFGLLINENDGMGRKGYYVAGDGISNIKSSAKFLRIPLVN